jgi:phage-related minor tail protein
MIDFYVPTLTEYNTATARKLAVQIRAIDSFDGIAQWDREAAEELERMRSALASLGQKVHDTSQALEQAQRNHKAKSFFARLFADRSEEKRLSAEQARLTLERQQFEQLVDGLEGAVDFTPNSPEDLKDLLREIRLKKKELQAEKKAVSTQVTQIRAEARQQTAYTSPGKYGTSDRRQIRLSKESALQPHETQKAALDRQIVRLDRAAAWLERFK